LLPLSMTLKDFSGPGIHKKYRLLTALLCLLQRYGALGVCMKTE
jgi:hypothetical protein